MKITGGEACGRDIDIPAHPGVRPTGSKMREALFNILGKLVENSEFLDVFAGSGLIGLEALSRGANFLTVVEKTTLCVHAIEANVEKLGYQKKAKIIPADFRRALNSLNPDQFTIIFADPPYMSEHGRLVLKLVTERKLLKLNGILIIEHDTKASLEPESKSMILLECRPYGQSAFSFFKFRGEPPATRDKIS
jgi:16S rRNA (guanine(966)-N(2))-methyltransferase RsmD